MEVFLAQVPYEAVVDADDCGARSRMVFCRSQSSGPNDPPLGLLGI